MTPCQCAQPGWCPRHGCHKTPHWWRLCRHRLGYFQLWEEGRGPGQHAFSSAGAEAPALPLMPGGSIGNRRTPTDQSPNESGASDSAYGEPGLVRKAANYGRETVRHFADRRRTVSEDLYQQRLAVCRCCQYCDLKRMLCRHDTCGCYLRRKARWRSARCPLHKWPPIEGDKLTTDN